MIILVNLIQVVTNIYALILLLRVLSSWLNADPFNPIVQLVYRLTEPFIAWIRRFIPTQVGWVDFSPMIAMLLVWLVAQLVIRMLLSLV